VVDSRLKGPKNAIRTY